MKNLVMAIRIKWATRCGPCLHPFYCVLLHRPDRTVK
jgi:hypothetical protein